MALTRVLLTNHWITAPLALAALDRFQASRVPLGRIALRERMLGLGPLLHILDQQLEDTTRGVRRRFGETAVALGYVKRPGGGVVSREFISDGAFEILVDGVRFPAAAFLRSPYDPGREKILQ